MHVSVVRFDTPTNVVGGDGTSGRAIGYRPVSAKSVGRMLQGYKHSDDPGVKCRSKGRVQRQVMLNTGTLPVPPKEGLDSCR